MNRPYKYTIFDKKTNEHTETNNAPLLCELQTYEDTDVENVKRLKQTKECYIDTRYDVKLRLFRYWQKLNGISEQVYKPYEGTEIGKSIPILNF